MKLNALKPAILVLYHARGVAQIPMRTAISDHLYCWSRHSVFPVICHNVAFGFDWTDYRDLPILGIVLDTTLLALRWSPESFKQKTALLLPLKNFAGPKLALPQDDFIHSDTLNSFMETIHVSHIASAATPKVAFQLYGARLPQAVLLEKLTGYLEDQTVKDIEEITECNAERPLHIGYRAWNAEYWLGAHGQLKVRVAQEALLAVQNSSTIKTDISLDDKDTFIGRDWYRFLCSCRATLGSEGGASINDHDGSLSSKTREFVASNPKATFEQVRDRCFPGRDGELELFALGPRHLEACATRTTQLLVEGAYQGVFRPGIDYIPIRRDFSNMGEVIAATQNDDVTSRIAASAYAHVVKSKHYTYKAFVRRLEAEIFVPFLRKSTRWSFIKDAYAVARAQRRQDQIAAFASHETEHLLQDRFAYDHSNSPEWVEARAYAQRMSRSLGFVLSPD